MKKYLLVFISSMLLWSCEDTEILDPTGELVVTDFNLPELPSSTYVYEAWLLVGGTYVSVGTINQDSINNNRAHFTRIERSDLISAESFAITIENSTSPAPSNYVLLVGDFNGGSADLFADGTSVNGITTLGNKISASYTLQNATVTTPNNTYSQNGIWFFKGEGETAETTLSLLYGELRYQAWLETEVDGAKIYVGMGTIASDSARDSRNAYTTQTIVSEIPDFAGEDFLRRPDGEIFPPNFFPRNVLGSKVILTPIFSNENSLVAPFPIFLLQSEIPIGVTNDVNITYPMQLNTNFGAKATKL